MTKSVEYRANAVDCMRLAAAVTDPETKPVFIQMAEAWLRLADYVELHKRYDLGDGLDGDGPPDLGRELRTGPEARSGDVIVVE